MLLQILKSLKKNLITAQKEQILLLENQKLYSENICIKRELEQKNKFLKNIPVGFKNHITSLIGFSSLLKQKENKLTDKQEQYLNNIVKTADLLDKEINEMLGIH
jgi:K+-sensing histidine kinase KdpD